MVTRRLFASFALLAALWFSACAVGVDANGFSDEELQYDGQSYKWIYDGPLPALEQPAINVSLTANTARVSGYLPANWQGELPYYADAVIENGRTHVAVVYPIATGMATNAPGDYTTIFGLPYVPTNTHATWGGFPFLEYNAKRGIALHGPITHQDFEWRLVRGPVSHGCNRMQGEHVTEVAQLIGIDMSKPHAASESYARKVVVHVSYDFDTWQGRYVDVDYPAMSGVKRPPASQSKLFSTWSSDDFPAFVCKYNKKVPLGPHHCDWAGQNRRDFVSGAFL